MTEVVKRGVASAIALGAGLLLSVPVQAQGIVVGGGLPAVTSPTGSYLALGGSYGYNGFNGGQYGYPGSYYPPYYPYPYDPAGDYLRGAADLVRGYGNYAVNYAQSTVILEKARQDVLDTRRKIYDQWLYERNHTPSLQDLRERDQRLELRRALNDPPVNEITEGKALNTLLKRAIATSAVS